MVLAFLFNKTFLPRSTATTTCLHVIIYGLAHAMLSICHNDLKVHITRNVDYYLAPLQRAG